jgi:hypothetical protein
VSWKTSCYLFITPFHLHLKDDFLSLRLCSHNILNHSRRSTNDEDLKDHYNKIWLFSMCLTSLLQRNTTKVPRFWHWNSWWNHKTSLNKHHMWFTLKWMKSQSLVVDITYTIYTSLFFVFSLFPMCSHEIIQNVPKSTSVLSHMVCPKFNSHEKVGP